MTIFTTGSLITAAGAQQLESSFAGASAPATPVTGQLWYDIPNAVLKVYTGSSWEKVSGSTVSVSETPPAGPAAGSLWFNVGDTVARMFVWTGTVWVDTNPSGSAIGGGVGVGQSWVNVTGSRSSGTTYTNSTSSPITVCFSCGHYSSTIVVNGVTISAVTNTPDWFPYSVTFVVPVGQTYSISYSAAGYVTWSELR